MGENIDYRKRRAAKKKEDELVELVEKASGMKIPASAEYYEKRDKHWLENIVKKHGTDDYVFLLKKYADRISSEYAKGRNVSRLIEETYIVFNKVFELYASLDDVEEIPEFYEFEQKRVKYSLIELIEWTRKEVEELYESYTTGNTGRFRGILLFLVFVRRELYIKKDSQ